MTLAGLGFGGGIMRVVTRKALLDETLLQAAGTQQSVDPAQLALELQIIHVAQNRGQSWTEGGLKG